MSILFSKTNEQAPSMSVDGPKSKFIVKLFLPEFKSYSNGGFSAKNKYNYMPYKLIIKAMILCCYIIF